MTLNMMVSSERLSSRHDPSFNPGYSGIIRDDPGMRLARGQQLILRCGGTDAARQDTPPEPVKEFEAGHSRDLSNIRFLFAYRRARRVRSRLPPPPSPADARTPRSLGGGPEFFLWMPGDFDGRGRAAEKTRHVWSEVARYAGDRLAGRFPWSGWGARESLPGHPSHGRRIGPRHGPMLSPSPSVVAPARVASRGHPGLSRIIPD